MLKTNKEVYDHVVPAMLKQNKKALNPNPDKAPFCMYRTPDGTRCAIGVCFPEELPTYINSWGGIKTLKESHSLFYNQVFGPEVTIEFLEEMQSVHDSCETPFWEQEFIKLGNKYGLI